MRIHGITNVGKIRKDNQDSFRIYQSSTYQLAVVCDGMGGANGGEYASQTAIQLFCNSIKSSFLSLKTDPDSQWVEESLQNAVKKANSVIYQKASSDAQLKGMGTTLCGVLFCDAGTFVVNVGDSRLYLAFSSELRQITKDNSFIQSLLDKGLITPQEALRHPDRNIILRAVGVAENIEIDFYRLDDEDFDQLLICSDGLYNTVPPEKMLDILVGNATKWPLKPSVRKKCKKLIQQANANGGNDNITAIIIEH